MTVYSTTFLGFQGTLVFAALELILHDPRIWEKPDEFYPEHFLKKDGSVDSKREGFMPFAAGKNSLYFALAKK